MADVKIQEGQVWKYDNRDGEDQSRAIILKLEDAKDGSMIVHIQVTGIKINNPNNGEMIEEISHMPFSIEAVGSCLVELIGETEIPDYQDGYENWKIEYDRGNAGVFSTSIGESVQFMDDTISG